MYTDASLSPGEVEQEFLATLDALLSSTGLPQFSCSLGGAPRVRAGALNLMGNLVVLGGVHALPYIAGIRRACLSLVRIDQPADVAAAALGVLDRLSEARVPADAMRPAELLLELRDALGRSGGQYAKKGTRPRGALCRSMGLLLHAYPGSFDGEVRRWWRGNPATAWTPSPPPPRLARRVLHRQSAWEALDTLTSAIGAEWGGGGGGGSSSQRQTAEQQQQQRDQERAKANATVDGCLRGIFHLLKVCDVVVARGDLEGGLRVFLGASLLPRATLLSQAYPGALMSSRVSARHFSSRRTLKQGARGEAPWICIHLASIVTSGI